MVEGWEKALSTMTVGERSTVRILDATAWGYGEVGFPPLVPGECPELIMDMTVLNSEKPQSYSLDSMLNPNTPVRNFFS